LDYDVRVPQQKLHRVRDPKADARLEDRVHGDGDQFRLANHGDRAFHKPRMESE
jgi:hypothetical protein